MSQAHTEQESRLLCVGREELLAALERRLAAGGPALVALHGPRGIGKSTLARALIDRMRASGHSVVLIDGNNVEPTEVALRTQLAGVFELPTADLPALVHCINTSASIVVLDGYEKLPLIDDWIRHALVPRLAAGVGVLMVGRQPPVAAWALVPAVQMTSLAVGALDIADERKLLQMLGVNEQRAAAIAKFARGHPLALRLAAALGSSVDATFDARAVIDALVRYHLAEIADAQLRNALLRASVVRRVTLPVLQALVPESDGVALLDALTALPIASWAPDGIELHEVVREALAAHFRSIDPTQYRAAREAAWRQLLQESESAGRADLWRYTADMLYLVESPAVREAFFPTRSTLLAVEPATAADKAEVLKLVERDDGSAGVACMLEWWGAIPEAFRVTRDTAGEVTGFYCALERHSLPAPLVERDALLSSWLDHLEQDPVEAHEAVLFVRRMLGTAASEQAEAVYAALYLDLKRSYLELRPRLRRLYATGTDLSEYESFMRPAGFSRLPEIEITTNERTQFTFVLDFGPGSVDGWLARLVATTLHSPDQPAVHLDERARELIVDGQRVRLAPLEFSLVSYLMARPGEALKRGDVLDDVWGVDFEGGSNVLDVAIRALRRKLGVRASCIETVTRYGYRFRPVVPSG